MTDDKARTELSKLNRGDWLSLQGVEIQALAGIVRPQSRWQLLNQQDTRVQEIRRERAARRDALSPALAPTRSVTAITGRQDLPASTVAQVLAHSPSPAMFRCPGLRVIAIPTDLRDITVPYCPSCDRPGFVFVTSDPLFCSFLRFQKSRKPGLVRSALRLPPLRSRSRGLCLLISSDFGRQPSADPGLAACPCLESRRGTAPTENAQMALSTWQEQLLGFPAVDLHVNSGALEQVSRKMALLVAEDAVFDCCLVAAGAYRLCHTRLA